MVNKITSIASAIFLGVALLVTSAGVAHAGSPIDAERIDSAQRDCVDNGGTWTITDQGYRCVRVLDGISFKIVWVWDYDGQGSLIDFTTIYL